MYQEQDVFYSSFVNKSLGIITETNISCFQTCFNFMFVCLMQLHLLYFNHIAKKTHILTINLYVWYLFKY